MKTVDLLKKIRDDIEPVTENMQHYKDGISFAIEIIELEHLKKEKEC